MEVERAVVDLYRAFMMKDRIGERFVGTVTAVVGSGLFVQLDAPFVDVLVRLEDLGHGHWEVDDNALRVVAARSGDLIALGDRIDLEVIDVSMLRRTVYAKRVGAGASDGAALGRGPSKGSRGKGAKLAPPARGPQGGAGDRHSPGHAGRRKVARTTTARPGTPKPKKRRRR
jgi:ribonuclease R